MAGLVGYASSDEEEEEVIEYEPEAQASAEAPAASSQPHDVAAQKSSPSPPAKGHETKAELSADLKQDSVVIGPVQQNAVPLGPSLPPMEESMIDEGDSTEPPLSPYSANRALVRDLTLPSVPNMDIPPSPPGSPPPGANKKFEQFLELKKKGMHFNAKLEQSAALKNPSLMDKLMDFVGIDERDQYSTTLSTDLWDPNGFPEWASRDKLKKAHDKIAKERESEKLGSARIAVDFVPSTMPSTGSNAAPGGLNRGEKRKGMWK